MGAREEIGELSIADVARDALKRAKNDRGRAAGIMARLVRQDVDLYRRLLDPMIELACYEAICKAGRNRNDAIWTAPNYDKGGNGERVKALAAGNALMFFQLPRGPLLIHATRAEVEEAAAFYREQADDMSVKAQWLSMVAKHLTGNKVVGKCLTEEKLRELQEKANG